MTASPPRPLPEVTAANEHFWRGGKSGRLTVLRCRACRYWIHPPAPLCPRCLSRELAAEPLSGEGIVVACTVNHKAWVPGDVVPYAIALVELPEQKGLRLLTTVVGCAPTRVKIGMRVRVRFEEQDDVWIPLFEPVGSDP